MTAVFRAIDDLRKTYRRGNIRSSITEAKPYTDLKWTYVVVREKLRILSCNNLLR